ncbi:peptidoglycan-associated lipoprotein Pal [Zavarzinia sp. CC-PAN008]|uniref:peptidoglycan-associated lipoprotein Pal n=1 Tax=Zavarzinia sp. CC-PAN008 TaxID=3243332 RepID=UPI003F747B42
MQFTKSGSKLVGLLAVLALVAACESTPASSDNTGGSGGPVTQSPPPSPPPPMAGGPIPGSAQDFEVNVGDRVFFDFDRSDLTPEGQATLQRQAAWLQQYPQVVATIEGHTDERGTREYNLGLGERRANSAKRFLVSQGIDSSRLSVISYGKERPAVDGSGEAVYAQNRRAVTVVGNTVTQ